MILRALCVFVGVFGSLNAKAQWVLDDTWGGNGRRMALSDRWEVPVAIDHDVSRVHMLSSAFDSTGTPEARWRAFARTNGAEVWSGQGFQGETPVDLRTSATADRWFLFTEAEVGPDSLPANVWRIRSFQTDALDTNWGAQGQVDLGFVGPWHLGGGMDMVGPADEWSRWEAVGPWMVVAGAAFDSCCAHRELPALALLSTEDGAFHPDFGQEGRIVLEPDGWLVEDSVRHEWSGRFTHALFVPTTSGYVFDPPTEMRILAGGTVATTGGFHPFVARFHWDGSLDTEFGNGGVVEWTEDVDVNHEIQDMRHRWNWYEVGAGIELLLSVPDGEQPLAAGTMVAGWMPLHGQIAFNPTADIDPGLPIQEPLRAVGLAAGYGWKFEDEQVAVGTLGDVVAWDGDCHPAWWTSYGSAFGSPEYWTEDLEFEQHRVGAAHTVGSRLYIAGTLAEDGPENSQWILSRWKEDNSIGVDEYTALPAPYPNPTSGQIHWELPAGVVECRDALGRLLDTWSHPGGRFSAVLPKGAVWLGLNGGSWQAVQVVR